MWWYFQLNKKHSFILVDSLIYLPDDDEDEDTDSNHNEQGNRDSNNYSEVYLYKNIGR